MKVACGVMYDKSGNILMGLRSGNGPNPWYWEFPGGKVEGKEPIKDCLRREWLEELNLNIEIDELIGINKFSFIECYFYKGKILDIENIKINVHSHIGFYTPKDILDLRLFDGDEDIVKKLL